MLYISSSPNCDLILLIFSVKKLANLSASSLLEDEYMGASLGEATTGADLGGSSKYSN